MNYELFACTLFLCFGYIMLIGLYFDGAFNHAGEIDGAEKRKQ
jgi:hypothetical protein